LGGEIVAEVVQRKVQRAAEADRSAGFPGHENRAAGGAGITRLHAGSGKRRGARSGERSHSFHEQWATGTKHPQEGRPIASTGLRISALTSPGSETVCETSARSRTPRRRRSRWTATRSAPSVIPRSAASRL